MNAAFNSAYVYIEDATGARYCQCFMRNDPASVESQKKHCRWYLRQRGTGVCRPAKIMVEFYHDDSAAQKPRRKAAAGVRSGPRRKHEIMLALHLCLARSIHAAAASRVRTS